MKQQTCKIGEFEATGKNKAEARQACEKQIVDACDRWFSPNLVKFGDKTTMIYPMLVGGICVRTYRTDGSWYEYLTDGDQRKAAAYAMLAMVQNSWSHDCPEDFGKQELTNHNMWDEFKSWRNWQLRYREAVISGMTPNQAHMAACGYN